ncbi:acyl-CoA dehydrogenase family protein [Caldinitratiruptor microaerophilus]|uniref:Acyl-CoA dehydrogenase n=1 Tax=Caldinitratiruptor microaerophilus TaxID=671077 RepID=A0AA35CKE4_9FIRM|nr:acyl-CoA dehydrogenase family protein [Caldinitratiruptor microaerophilus]BDG58945.1 acyl-CoA dehydrogenase [Caldinitratiruptor microaerophilus]
MTRHKGGSFLIEAAAPEDVFTPEDLSAEQRAIGDTVREFVEREVWPALPAMERHEFEHNVRLLRRAAELGLTGIEIPEEFGGLGLDKVTAAVVTENMGPGASFAVTFGAHTGIGTLPIVFFGNRDQKARYLPALASAEKIAAYALTEPESGSDALSARTTARLSPDGQHYILNGTKQWISNGGFADVFVLYAKVDGEKFTAFIVERGFPGVSTGAEEHKMGLLGSSTVQVILQDAQVPVANVLHEVGKGHQVAFNILNIGRFKLAAGCVGSSKHVLGLAARYAQERHQFGRPIASFPLIQQKLADMAVRTYAAESMVYRTAGLLEEGLAEIDPGAEDAGRLSARAIHEYAVEASANKVFASEVLDFVVDEGVQIHGGYGYMREYEVERAFRDARINRIFEGTNEINRLLVPGELVRRALKGDLALLPAMEQLQRELVTLVPPVPAGAVPLEVESWLVEAARKLTLMVAGLGVQKYGTALEGEQELLAGVADMVIDLFAMESAILRARKAVLRSGPEDAQGHVDLATAATHDAFDRIESTARRLLAAIEEGDALRSQLAVVRKLARRDPVNRVALGRRIARRVLAAGGYTVAG